MGVGNAFGLAGSPPGMADDVPVIRIDWYLRIHITVRRKPLLVVQTIMTTPHHNMFDAREVATDRLNLVRVLLGHNHRTTTSMSKHVGVCLSRIASVKRHSY